MWQLYYEYGIIVRHESLRICVNDVLFNGRQNIKWFYV
jgi:hypothetical protein